MGTDQRTSHSITRVWHMHAGTISPQTAYSGSVRCRRLCRLRVELQAERALSDAPLSPRAARSYTLSRAPPRVAFPQGKASPVCEMRSGVLRAHAWLLRLLQALRRIFCCRSFPDVPRRPLACRHVWVAHGSIHAFVNASHYLLCACAAFFVCRAQQCSETLCRYV